MDLQVIIAELKTLEFFAKRLPQMVYDCDNSAYLLAKIVARRYNELLDLYPVTPRVEREYKVDITPRLVKKP